MIEEKTPAAATTERVLRMLSKLYNQTAQMLYAFSHGMNEDGYQMALENERLAERMILAYRDIPINTGRPSAMGDVNRIIAEEVPVEMGYTQEGWFMLKIPELLPLKEKKKGSFEYIRGYLYPAMEHHFENELAQRIEKCVVIYRHIYAKDYPEKEYRDYDNIEINFVTDAIALYVMVDDAPSRCELYHFTSVGDENRTEVYVVPKKDFADFYNRVETPGGDPITICKTESLLD